MIDVIFRLREKNTFLYGTKNFKGEFVMKLSWNWTKQPVTWGAVVICNVIGVVAALIEFGCIYGTFESIGEKIGDWLDRIRN